jgi:hypothetical protein
MNSLNDNTQVGTKRGKRFNKIDGEFMQNNAKFFRRFEKGENKLKVKDSSKFQQLINQSHGFENFKPVHEFLNQKIMESRKQRYQFRKSTGYEDIILNSIEKDELADKFQRRNISVDHHRESSESKQLYLISHF